MPGRRHDETFDPDGVGDDGPPAHDPARYGPDQEELGRGGLGRVVRVHDRHLDRRVARKELLVAGALVGARSRARFEREARIAARLEHPNILPIYEFGVEDDGSPWYTTRAIRGPTLARALADAPTLGDRLRLLPCLVATGQALAYAHAERVVHRDVTPRNIMVGPFGETVLIDWGLAKVLDEPDDLSPPEPGAASVAAASLTIAGTPHGTVGYASPEQLAGDLDHIDARSDVWGLGATLYHLLTGRPPRTGDRADEVIPPVRAIAADAPAELASIAARALAPAPEARYPSMAAMVADLQAWEAGRTVAAHTYGLAEHLQRVVRARPREAVIAGAASVGVASSLLLVAATWVVKEGEEQEARSGRATAAALLAAGEGRHALSLRHAVEALSIHERADVRGAVIAAGRRWLPRPVARWTVSDCETPVPSRDGVSVACLQGDTVVDHVGGTTWSWRLPTPASVAAWSATGDVLAVAQEDGRVVLLRPGVTEPAVAGVMTSGSPFSLAWIDDRRLASGTTDGSIEILADGRATVLVPTRGERVIVTIDTSGDLLLAGSTGGLEAWRISTGELAWSRAAVDMSLVVAVPGRPFVVATAPAADGSPFVYTLARDSGATLATAELAGGGQGRPAVTPDGLTALVPSATGVVTALSLPGLEVRGAVDLDAPVRPRLAVGGGGLLVARADGMMERWALPDPWPARSVKAAPGLVYSAVLSPSGDRLLTPTSARIVRSWTLPTLAPDETWSVPAGSLASSAWVDDSHAVVTGPDGRVFLLGPGEVEERPPVFAGSAYGLFLDGAGAMVAGGQRGEIGRWQISTGAIEWERALGSVIVGFAAVSGGRSLVVPTLGDGVHRLRTLDGVEEEHFDAQGRGYSARPAASPDGASVALGQSRSVGGGIERRSASTLGERAWETPTDGRPAQLAWSPDGEWIAAGLLDGQVLVLSASTGAIRAQFRAHPGQVWGVTYIDAGRALASTGSDGTVRVWDLSDLTTPAAELGAALQPPPLGPPTFDGDPPG